jgi:acylphosphatase
MTARLLRIQGLVQGVGFRYALGREAERRGVAGWVRNRADGSVEALLSGNAEAVEALTAWARRGPPAARVSEVIVSPAGELAATPGERFEQRPTL